MITTKTLNHVEELATIKFDKNTCQWSSENWSF